MKLQSIRPIPMAGLRIQCAECLRMVEAASALADLDAEAGTYYCVACANLIKRKATS